MFIPDDKRAQIAAGARPEDVLSESELEQYKAELEEAQREADTAGQDTRGDEGAGDQDEGTQASEPQEGAQAAVDLNTELRQALKENGRLEARAEAAEAKAESLEHKLVNQKAQMESLQEIGKLAVNNLQVALGLPKESASSPEGLVTMYTDLQQKMAERFSRGRNSKQESLETDIQADLPLAFRSRK